MEPYRISVVIPTYNRAAQIVNAIQSVKVQAYAAHEIIVVDDGSVDNTRSVVRGFVDSLSKSDTAVRYIYQAQQGVSVARNNGLASALGDWVAFLDSDDRWLPDKLELQVRALEELDGQCGLCFTDALHVNNSQWDWTVFEAVGASFKDNFGVVPNASEYVVGGSHGIYIQTVLVRRDLANKVGGFDSRLRIYEDNDFVFRVSLHTKFAFVNKPLVEVNRSPDRGEGLMELYAKEDFRLQQIEYEHQKWLKECEVGPRVRRLIEVRLQQIFAGWASLYLMRGRKIDARRSMQHSLSHGLTAKGIIKWALITCMPKTAQRFAMRRYEQSLKAMLPGLRS